MAYSPRAFFEFMFGAFILFSVFFNVQLIFYAYIFCNLTIKIGMFFSHIFQKCISFRVYCRRFRTGPSLEIYMETQFRSMTPVQFDEERDVPITLFINVDGNKTKVDTVTLDRRADNELGIMQHRCTIILVSR